MRHNSVVSGHSKSTGIPRVDVLSTGPLDLGLVSFKKIIALSENLILGLNHPNWTSIT